jgi:Neuraminidase (sialidase)
MSKLPGPSRVAKTDSYDGAVSQLILIENDKLLLFYHENDHGHVGPDGRIVMRRSTNYGKTWSERRIVHHVNNKNAINPSVIYIPRSGRIVLFDEVIDFAGSPDPQPGPNNRPQGEDRSTYLIESTDHGQTWHEPVEISEKFNAEEAVPHGGGVRNSTGVRTFFYNEQIEMLHSKDGGKTWDRSTPIVTSPGGRELTEPIPCKITDKKILLFGRDNEEGDFYALKSSDGGETWSGPVFFDPTNTTAPTPIYIKKTSRNELTGVWGDRGDGYIYAITVSAQLAWQDPQALAEEPRRRIHEQISPPETASYWDGTAGDFGYPTFVQLGPDQSDILTVFYDESPRPNLWQMTLY